MCLIIYKKTANQEIPSHILDNAEKKNPDGFGISFLDGNYETVKTMDYKEARKLVEMKRPFVAHYRYTTKGATNEENCHPFAGKKRFSTFQLYSNGTVEQYGTDEKTDTEEVKELLERAPRSHWESILRMSVTRFAIVEKNKVTVTGDWIEKEGILYSKNNCFTKPYTPKTIYYPKNTYYRGTQTTTTATATKKAKPAPAPKPPSEEEKEEEFLDARDQLYSELEILKMYPSRNDILWDISFYAQDGLYDSELALARDGASAQELFDSMQKNDRKALIEQYTVKDDTPRAGSLLAVYGTLKKGFYNQRLLLGSKHVGNATSREKLAMVGQGVPFVLGPHAGGHHINVEIYEPTQKAWREIDRLEGHPDWYIRKIKSFKMDGKTNIKSAWIYILKDPQRMLNLHAPDKFLKNFPE